MPFFAGTLPLLASFNLLMDFQRYKERDIFLSIA
jgi:hypothetical protein